MSEKIDAQRFKNDIFNYELSKEWKFSGDLPAIVDFYADWCGPCKMVSPVLDQLSKDYEGKLRVFKVNTDEEQELSAAFGIQSIPTILFIPKDGQPRVSMGAMPEKEFERVIAELLLPAEA